MTRKYQHTVTLHAPSWRNKTSPRRFSKIARVKNHKSNLPSSSSSRKALLLLLDKP
jgi:hypothetical protein